MLDRDKCPNCGGDGVVEILAASRFYNATVKCPKCKGTGWQK